MDSLRQYLRYALRTLVGAPSLDASAILSLALGVATVVAVGAWTVGVPLSLLKGRATADRRVAPAVRASSQVSRDDVVQHDLPLTLCDGHGPVEQIRALVVSSDFFDALHVPVLLGRGFLPGEERPGGQKTVVLSHALWQRRFGSDPRVIGRAVHLDAQRFTVVGVAPPELHGRRDLAHDAFLPLGAVPIVGRPAAGVSLGLNTVSET